MTLSLGEPFPIGVLERLHTELDEHDGPAVVWFFPAAGTRTCSRQADAFNAAHDAFERAGIKVVGVSVDEPDALPEFRAEHGLVYPLVSDAETELTRQLDLWKEGQYGELAQRVTFLLDRDRIVRHVRHVDEVEGHPSEVLEAAERLERA
ncbi:MAG: peroxiredoxin [Egibacteraceae bacterium]